MKSISILTYTSLPFIDPVELAVPWPLFPIEKKLSNSLKISWKFDSADADPSLFDLRPQKAELNGLKPKPPAPVSPAYL